jgi:UDP-N-acetylmuramoyl-L-alanyl-D-glutamate--2,6-diaminopimelate ligase
MGEIAGKIADFTIITSDNPRNEDPLKIISEIESGLKKHTKNYKCIENRLKATKFGVKMLQKGDILCVLGKGAEKVQEIKGKKLRYNDKQSIKKIISGGENS